MSVQPKLTTFILIMFLILFIGIPLVQAAVLPDNMEAMTAHAYVPEPNLRITAKGILGSDGTRFESETVTAKLPGDELVTQATTKLTYSEFDNKVIDASRDRNVIQYLAKADGIFKHPLVAKRGEKESLWLPINVEAGAEWKSAWGSRRRVMQSGLTVETAAGLFEGCMMIEYDVYAGGTGIERHYIAPGVGLVKVMSLKGPQSSQGQIWFEIQSIEKLEQSQAEKSVNQMLGK